ncbi:hypothetical protein [Sphingomonas sp. PvP055]|uniref:hypothetical protein n=1 Tax=Sphingomonas sp. PvP055 TaxID=3156391 RepID=UPI003399D340
MLKHSHTITLFEPFTLLSALAMVTSRIGLGATTTFAEKMDEVQLYKLFGHSFREYLQVGAF